MANMALLRQLSAASTQLKSSVTSFSYKRLIAPSGTIARKRILAWVLVFTTYLLTAQIGVYLYRDIGTYPALVWPPVGIALAAVLIEGYWIISAVAVAAFINGLLIPAAPPLFIILGSLIANTIQPLIGGYVLRRLSFNPLMSSLRDVFLLIFVAGIITAIMPLINFGFTEAYNLLADTSRTLPSWHTIWIGSALSVFVLTPFLSRWIGTDLVSFEKYQLLESSASTFLVLVISFLLFATPISSSFGTFLLLMLFAALFWVAFRTGPRMMTVALLGITSISLAGAIYGVHAPSASGVEPSLGQRLISVQVFDLICCLFFFILASVEEQRKEAIKKITAEAVQLDAALKKIQKEDKAKNEFIAILAHELRNPLAPIMSGLELLLLDEQAGGRKEVLQSAKQQSLLMRRLLDELLDVARITQRTFTLYREEVSLDVVLKQSIQTAQYFYKERRMTMVTEFPEESLVVHGDTMRLSQVFTNLLYNAGKYSAEDSVVKIMLSQADRIAIIRVIDTGIGIEKEMLEHVFEPFIQDQRAAEVGTGLGIGLAIAKRLVEMHGGSIKVESMGKNKGTTFTIRLPLHSLKSGAVLMHAPNSYTISSAPLATDYVRSRTFL